VAFTALSIISSESIAATPYSRSAYVNCRMYKCATSGELWAEPEAELMQCEEHGESEPAFICSHLLEDGVQLWSSSKSMSISERIPLILNRCRRSRTLEIWCTPSA